jgi:hypothetical protein
MEIKRSKFTLFILGVSMSASDDVVGETSVGVFVTFPEYETRRGGGGGGLVGKLGIKIYNTKKQN